MLCHPVSSLKGAGLDGNFKKEQTAEKTRTKFDFYFTFLGSLRGGCPPRYLVVHSAHFDSFSKKIKTENNLSPIFRTDIFILPYIVWFAKNFKYREVIKRQTFSLANKVLKNLAFLSKIEGLIAVDD